MLTHQALPSAPRVCRTGRRQRSSARCPDRAPASPRGSLGAGRGGEGRRGEPPRSPARPRPTRPHVPGRRGAAEEEEEEEEEADSAAGPRHGAPCALSRGRAGSAAVCRAGAGAGIGAGAGQEAPWRAGNGEREGGREGRERPALPQRQAGSAGGSRMSTRGGVPEAGPGSQAARSVPRHGHSHGRVSAPRSPRTPHLRADAAGERVGFSGEHNILQ